MADFFYNLFMVPSVPQSLLILVLTVAVGLFVESKVKIGNFSLGVTWILFAGILLSHFGLRLEPHVAHFAKDFGLILFVYSIGLQVGPSFFSSFGKGGLRLNVTAAVIVVMAAVVTWLIATLSGEDMATMVGVMSGAVTNTPSLGAAEQAYSDIFTQNNNTIAAGYAVAYPLGVVGILFAMLLVKWLFRIDIRKEEQRILQQDQGKNEPVCFDVKVTNERLNRLSVSKLHHMCKVDMVISRIIHSDMSQEVPLPATLIKCGDTLRILCDKEHADFFQLFGPITERPAAPQEQKANEHTRLVSRRIVVTEPEWNGQEIRKLGVNTRYHITISRVKRAGIDLLATPGLRLQIGDRLMVVGDEEEVKKVAELFGNQLKRLDVPNLFPIFFGIVLGIIAGLVPIHLPGLAQPFKLGLAGGTLIVAILIGRFGPYHHLVTFSTTSANRMIREVGIALFLAAVGLGAGETFVPTLRDGGYMWILYGLLITLIPLIAAGIVARKWLKLDYFTLMGLIAGSTTDPPALSYAVAQSSETDKPSVAYATVYPLTMFLRVMIAQLMIIFLC